MRTHLQATGKECDKHLRELHLGSRNPCKFAPLGRGCMLVPRHRLPLPLGIRQRERACVHLQSAR